MTSPRVCGTRPASSASSCTLGFTRSGSAERLSASAAPEVSTATGTPLRCPSSTTSPYQLSCRPAGRLPAQTSQPAPRMCSATARSSRSISSSLRLGPASLILVTEPFGWVRLMLLRISPAMGTTTVSNPAESSICCNCAPTGPPAVTTARTGTSCACSARATLTPLPLGSLQLRWLRFTEPSTTSSMSTVRSTLGLGVRVTIMLAPLRFRRCAIARSGHRRGRYR